VPQQINFYVGEAKISTVTANSGELFKDYKPSYYGESYLLPACTDDDDNEWNLDTDKIPDNASQVINLHLIFDLSEAYTYDQNIPEMLSYVYTSLNITGGQTHNVPYAKTSPVIYRDLVRAYYTVTNQKHLFNSGGAENHEDITFKYLKDNGLIPNNAALMDTASVKETVAILANAYQANYRAYVDDSFNEVTGDTYPDTQDSVISSGGQTRSSLRAAYAFGIQLYESGNLRPNKTATQRQFAYIIKLLDEVCGSYLNHIYDSEGNIDYVLTHITYDIGLIAEFNDNLKDFYQCIRDGIPAEVYTKPFSSGTFTPTDSFKKSFLEKSNFNTTLSEYAKLCKEIYNVEMTIEMDFSFAYQSTLLTDFILRPKMNITANPDNISLAELFDVRTMLNLYKEKLLADNEDATAVYDVFTQMYGYGYSIIFNNTSINFICDGDGNTAEPADILNIDIYFQIVVNTITDPIISAPRFVVYFNDTATAHINYVDFEIMLLKDHPLMPPAMTSADDPTGANRDFVGWVYHDGSEYKPIGELTSIPTRGLQIFATWEDD